MKRCRFELLAIWLVGALVFALCLPPAPVAAQSTALLRFHPQPLSVEEGQSFRVEVRVSSVEGLYGAQLFVNFNPLVLQVQSVELGPFLSPQGMSGAEYNNAAGTLDMRIAQVSPSQPVSGSGTLATITFRALAPGSSVLDFVDRSAALKTLLCDRDGNELPAVVQDGVATAYGVSRLELVPASESLVAGEALTYTARIYDQDGRLLADVTSGTAFSISAGAGGAWVGATYTSEKAGTWQVTGRYTTAGGKALVGTATLEVAPAQPSAISLAAADADLLVGESTTITATVTDRFGNRVADGTLVTFACTLGSFNGAATSQAPTANGIATVAYTATAAGVDTITATAGTATAAAQVSVGQQAPGPEPGPGGGAYRVLVPLLFRG